MRIEMKKGNKVQLQKITHLDEACYSNEDANNSPDGQKSDGIPEGYILRGELLSDIVIGDPIIMLRHNRNGVDALGITQTTLVTEIVGEFVKTNNSTYKVT